MHTYYIVSMYACHLVILHVPNLAILCNYVSVFFLKVNTSYSVYLVLALSNSSHISSLLIRLILYLFVSFLSFPESLILLYVV